MGSNKTPGPDDKHGSWRLGKRTELMGQDTWASEKGEEAHANPIGKGHVCIKLEEDNCSVGVDEAFRSE
uniref:Uncharacterized protein n=1 Tax=Cannabis sativa TaxID=3483 RepID=A0A803PQ47_CANSA